MTDEEKKEFEGLFVNLADESDSESLDFVPKKKVFNNFFYFLNFIFLIQTVIQNLDTRG